MKTKKNWTKERFQEQIVVLTKEGLIWIDKKTGTAEFHYYFPSLIRKFIDDNTANLYKSFINL